jgi:methyl-CpG-binding domain protein 4
VQRIKIIQEEYANDPWKVLVCCILLNQTSNKQVRPLIENFFKKWPNSKSLIWEDDLVISDFIKTTGFQNVKAKRIKNFSSAWESGVRDPFKFPGIGDYGREAWRIFVTKDISFIPKDKKLKMYLESIQ